MDNKILIVGGAGYVGNVEDDFQKTNLESSVDLTVLKSSES
jgi:hypothetical protein